MTVSRSLSIRVKSKDDSDATRVTMPGLPRHVPGVYKRNRSSYNPEITLV